MSAGNRCSGSCVDAEFAVHDWPGDARGDEGVPTSVDDAGEAGGEGGVEVGGDRDDAVELGLMFGCVPENDVVATDGEVEGLGGLAEWGAVAVGWEQVKVFVDVVGILGVDGEAVGGFGSPDLWWCIDEEGSGWPRGGQRN